MCKSYRLLTFQSRSHHGSGWVVAHQHKLLPEALHLPCPPSLTASCHSKARLQLEQRHQQLEARLAELQQRMAGMALT